MLTSLKCTSGLLLSGSIFTSALILAFVYTFAQDNRGKKAHFIVVQIPVEYLPWCMITLTLVLGGWPAALDEGMGIIAAHAYDFLTRLYPQFQHGKNYVQTPKVIARWFGADQSAFTHKRYGTSFRPASVEREQPSRGWSTVIWRLGC